VARGLAQGGHRDPAFWEAAAAVVARDADGFEFKHDTDLLRAFALVPHVHAGALRVLTDRLCAARRKPTTKQLPVLFRACGQLEFKAPAFLAHLSTLAMQRRRDLTPRDWIQVLWGCARARHKDDALVDAALACLHGHHDLHDWSPEEAAMLAWACARLRIPDDDLLARLGNWIKDQHAATMTREQLLSVAAAYGALRFPHKTLFSALAHRVVDSGLVDKLTCEECVTLLLAFARVNVRNRVLVVRVGRRLSNRDVWRHLTGPEVQRLLWVAKSLGLREARPVLEALGHLGTDGAAFTQPPAGDPDYAPDAYSH